MVHFFGWPACALQTRAAFLNDQPSYLLYFWELKCFKHRLSDGTGDASDALCAGVSTAASGSTSSCNCKCRQQDDDNDDSTLLPLVQPFQELVDCQQQLLNDRDRNHEQRIKCQFNWCCMVLHRKLNAELYPNNEQNSRLSTFSVSECFQIEAKILSLELEMLNNNA